MGDAAEDRAKAKALPEGDVIRVLLEQHAQVRDLFDEVRSATGEDKKQAFDALRALLAVHETAEELVLRPVTEKVVGEAVAHARDAEEKEANAVLAHLERISVDDPNFDAQLAAFEEAVDRHAEAEEQEEFPQILATCEESERQTMGRRIRAVEAIAPTHPHPTVAGNRNLQLLTGPLASFVDRARDAIGSIR